MQYGHFDDQHREYLIERPDTPLPWINYLGMQDYFGIISNTGGGYSFYKDSRLRRLTRYRYNNTPLDEGGRYIYLRDRADKLEEGAPRFWSPTWQPTRTPLDDYVCRHGLGYTSIASQVSGIRAQVRYFIPLDQNLEIWDLTIKNERDTRADLSAFSALEFCLWDAWDDATNYQRNYSIGEVEVEDGVIYHKSEYRERRNHFAYFACSQPLAGFDTQREDFLGAYRGWDRPAAVERGQAGDSIAHGWQPIGSHQVDLSLAPGEEQRILFVLGYYENDEDEKFDPPGSQTINKAGVKPIIARFTQPEVVDQAFTELKAYWAELLARFQVDTPDEHTDRMVNTWNLAQMMATFNFSRSASYFESGIGRGMGFRDSNQDILGFVHLIPERARERLLELASTQLPSGGAYHQYQPLTKEGNNDIGGNFNDDPLWLVLAAAAYLKETGDWSLLDESLPYDNQPGTETAFYEHLQRALQYTLDRLGPHGLPLIGRADWNDCLNLNTFSSQSGESFQTTGDGNGEVAESMFIAPLFILAAGELVQIARRRRAEDDAARYEKAIAEMEAAVWEAGWDGDWFRRAYDHYGHPVGSQENEEGQIYIEPQGMAVMAGLGLEDGRAQQALDSVADRLATEHGVMLHQPAYTRYQLHLGEITSYPPGYKENAGVFCHTNPWIMIAEARLGRGDQAHDYYTRINPSAREGISELHKCEPYVYAQMIAGRDAPSHGEAKNSWLTGTAAWNYVAITQWILGIRPTYEGLEIAPVIPQDWPGFSAVRHFRGQRYEIEVERRGPGNNVQLEVNGKPIEGTVIAFHGDGTETVGVKATIS